MDKHLMADISAFIYLILVFGTVGTSIYARHKGNRDLAKTMDYVLYTNIIYIMLRKYI